MAVRKATMDDKPMERIVVVIDEEAQFRRLLKICLETNGYKVYEAANGHQGLTEVASRHPHLVLLELGLPDMEGLDVVSRLREWSHVPIIILSNRKSEHDKVTALRGGADDYLTKPFGTGELLARLQVALRHVRPAVEEPIFTSGRLTVDLAARIVRVAGHTVKLTKTEYNLLQILLRNAGKVLTHPQIMESVWGPGHLEKTHYLHVYMTYLREKIERNPAKPELLMTEPRVGYWLNLESPANVGAVQPCGNGALAAA
jgi:two-component system KDP operon response regulator KdpE